MAEKETCPTCGKYGYSFLHSCPGIPQLHQWEQRCAGLKCSRCGVNAEDVPDDTHCAGDIAAKIQASSLGTPEVARGVDPNDLLIPLAPAADETVVTIEDVLAQHRRFVHSHLAGQRGWRCSCGLRVIAVDNLSRYQMLERHVAAAVVAALSPTPHDGTEGGGDRG